MPRRRVPPALVFGAIPRRKGLTWRLPTVEVATKWNTSRTVSGAGDVKKFEYLNLTMVLAVAGAVSGCDRHKDQGWEASTGPTRVCVDQQGKRVSEDRCGTTRPVGGGVSPFLWYYLGSLNRGGYAPGYGGLVGGGSYQPRPGVAYGTLPPSGITRGGFGGTARSFGGFGGFGAGE